MRFFFIGIISLCLTSMQAQSLGRDRVERLKKAVVRIIVDDSISIGTGFFVSQDLVATSFHVISGTIDLSSSKRFHNRKVEIELANGTRRAVNLQSSIRTSDINFERAQAYDYALLEVAGKGDFEYAILPLGNFDEIEGGDEIYSSGYSLRNAHHILAKGMFSTKFELSMYRWVGKDTTYYHRRSGWLDLTMYRGSSGGPIIKLGPTPEEDVVVGMASFSLNPFGQRSQELAEYFYSDKSWRIGNPDKNMQRYFGLLSEAVAESPVGVGGCVAIDHLRKAIPKNDDIFTKR